MNLTNDNYYSQKSNLAYMSVSQFKDFAGTYGKEGCEYQALERLYGRYTEEPSLAMQVGSYVDSYFEGTLNDYQKRNPEMFKNNGELKAPFLKAEELIKRIERDSYFMKFLSGEKQTILTGSLFGCEWKIKMDSYIPGVAIVDLKVMSNITKLHWVRDIGYLDFVRYWGYDIQGAIYQKIVEINTGKKLPFYIAAITKEDEPDIRIIHVTQNHLDEALSIVERLMPRVLEVKNLEVSPEHCDICNCCKRDRVLTEPITILDLATRLD